MNILRALFLVATLATLVVGAPSAAVPSARVAGMSAEQPESEAQPSAADLVERDGRRAEERLEELASRYQYLDGVTVEMGRTPKSEQAVSYYTDGEIVVSPAHTATIDEILAHEVWHVIDWRDNGRLDWGEDLPPVNSSDYLKR